MTLTGQLTLSLDSDARIETVSLLRRKNRESPATEARAGTPGAGTRNRRAGGSNRASLSRVRRAFLALAAIAVVSVIGGVAYGRTDHDDHAARPVKVAVAARPPRRRHERRPRPLGLAAYVVGGYTGTRWLNTIVAWRPGAAARVVGRLPTPLRYAAAATADGQLVVAGGSTPSGSASRAVLAFDPATHHVRRLGRLPAPTTHAAAASP